MSGVVKIEIRETEEELKALLRKEKDVTCYEKLQVLYWLKTQRVEAVEKSAIFFKSEYTRECDFTISACLQSGSKPNRKTVGVCKRTIEMVEI